MESRRVIVNYDTGKKEHGTLIATHVMQPWDGLFGEYGGLRPMCHPYIVGVVAMDNGDYLEVDLYKIKGDWK